MVFLNKRIRISIKSRIRIQMFEIRNTGQNGEKSAFLNFIHLF